MKDNKRLKILILTRWYPNKENPIAGIFVRENATAVSLYNDVIVLYNERRSRRKVKGLGLYEVFSDKKEDGIRTIRIKHRKGPTRRISQSIYLYSVWSIFKKLVKQGSKPDIIHVHVFSAGKPAVIIGKKYKIPVVIAEHSTSFPRHILKKRDISKARFIMNNADIILPVSRNLESAVKSYGIENQFEVVPNVVNTNMFYPPSNTKYSKKKKILFVSRICEIKGITFLLRALARLKSKRQDFILDVVGGGQNRADYEELTEHLGLSEIVKFHGLKTKEEVAEFMRGSDFFVLPSLWENLPCVLIEAMASGLPVIASNICGIPEIVTENTGILLPPKDVNSLTKAIDYMLDHYQDYSPQKISQYANDNFSCEVVGKKLNDIYRNILRERPH